MSAKLERLIALTERLTETLAADIAMLEQGRAREMRVIEPGIQQLTLLYNREANGVDIATTKSAPPALRERLMQVTKRFRETLALHARVLTRVKNASEGLIQAIASDVDRKRTAARPYGRIAPAPRSTGAMLYNNVV